MPQFAGWLADVMDDADPGLLTPEERTRLDVIEDPAWIETGVAEAVKPLLLRLAAHYFLHAKADGEPVDPVARFHLGNGARLERINWAGDTSPKGLRAAHGLMCNYRYEIKDIEKNHEAYKNEGTVAASRQVHALLKPERGRPDGGKLLTLSRLRTGRPAIQDRDR
jgi:malonyl-CoA decarboxylase